MFLKDNACEKECVRERMCERMAAEYLSQRICETECVNRMWGQDCVCVCVFEKECV